MQKHKIQYIPVGVNGNRDFYEKYICAALFIVAVVIYFSDLCKNRDTFFNFVLVAW